MLKNRHTPRDEIYFLIRTLSADFNDSQTLSTHSHPWGQLIYAASGVMTVWTEQGSWVAPPHWAVWAPAGVAHAMRFTGRTSVRTLYLRPELAAGLSPRSAVITVSGLLRELVLRAVDIGFLDERVEAHAAMARLIVHEIHAHPAAPTLDLPMPQSTLLRQVAAVVLEAPADREGHAMLSKRFGIGARTLERGFVSETGLTLGRWRSQARFLHALRLLGGGAAVKEVAIESGYQSPSAFIAAFRRSLGTTPCRYFGSP